MVTRQRIETYTMQHAFDLYISDCAHCGVPFGIPKAMERRRRQDGRSFYCPNGHSLFFSTNETEEEKLKKKLLRKQREAEVQRQRAVRAEQDAAAKREQMEAALEEVERTRKRTAGGVCPCCNRSFEELANHIRSKHPDYVDMVTLPMDVRRLPRVKAVTVVIEASPEPLGVRDVLGRLVLAGRRQDTERQVRDALYRAGYSGLIKKTGKAQWS